MRLFLISFIVTVTFVQSVYSQKQISITFDDPNTYATPLFSWEKRNSLILEILEKFHIKSALFVCGMRVSNEDGATLLKSWDSLNHLICNHSFSHKYFNSSKVSLEDYTKDFLLSDSIISSYKNYTRLFRFPFLKEGNTHEKINGMRDFLQSVNYRNGYVTVDASDWYIDSELTKELESNPNSNGEGYKQFYIQHILNRIAYYDSLAVKLFKRNIPHTLLLHHNLLNALFLDDLLSEIKSSGWQIVDAKYTYTDSIYSLQPNVIPAGESLIWQCAKLDSNLSQYLRYPAEDKSYEIDTLSRFLKSYNSFVK